jgi:hypothetical protein
MYINHVTSRYTFGTIIMLKWVSHLSLSWPAWIQDHNLQHYLFKIPFFLTSSHTCKLSKCVCVFSSASRLPHQNPVWIAEVSHTHPSYPFGLFIWGIFNEEYTLWRSSLCNFSIFLIAKRTSSAPNSETDSAYMLPLTWETKFHVNIQYIAVIC